MARRRQAGPLATGDVLPRDLMPSAFPDLFTAFTRAMPDGRHGIDMETHTRQEQAETARRRRIDEWFAVRGIKTKFADRDPRFLEVLERSRAHWGLNHQGRPMNN